MAEESSFASGFKGGLGVIFALFFVFIIAPCVMCSGLAMCGTSMESFDRYTDRAERAGTTTTHAPSPPGDDDGETAQDDSEDGPKDDEPSHGKWLIHAASSAMDDSDNVHISLRSDNQVEDWLGRRHHGTLIVRCRENSTSVIVRTETQANPEVGNFQKAHARIRLDDGSPTRVNLSESTSGEALFFPGTTRYAREFIGHELLRFEFTPFRMAPQILEFDLRGYEEVLPEVQAACNWD